MPLLPHAPTASVFEPLWGQPVWSDAVAELQRRHHLPGTFERATGGENIVHLSAHHALKLFPPYCQDEHLAETSLLPRVAGRLGVATPELEAAGELEGWFYVVLSRVEGVPIHTVWKRLSEGDQARLCARVGEILAALHQLPAEGIDLPQRRWGEFLPARLGAWRQTQARYGADDVLLEVMAEIVERGAPLLQRGQIAPLHADLHYEQIFVAERDGRWEVASVLDFADGMVGDTDYDFVSPGAFVARGRACLRAMLLGYGLPPEALHQDLALRLTTLTVLHRFAAVAHLLGRRELLPQVTSADALIEALFPLGEAPHGALSTHL